MTLLLTILAVLAILLYRRRTEFRLDWQRRGRCVQCGYDLRKTAGRCPECNSVSFPTAQLPSGPLPPGAIRKAFPQQRLVMREHAFGERRYHVFRTTDWGEADELHELFIARGMACSIKIAKRADGSTMIDDDSLLPVLSAMVYEGDKELAVELIRALRTHSARQNELTRTNSDGPV